MALEDLCPLVRPVGVAGGSRAGRTGCLLGCCLGLALGTALGVGSS